MICRERLNGGRLLCTRTDEHDAGHVYMSEHGSEVADAHTASEAVQE